MIRRADSLTAAEATAVRALAAAAEAADGHPPLSEQVLLHLAEGAQLLAESSDGALDGYAHLEGSSAELVVHPDARRRGVGRALAAALLEFAPDLVVWAHGEHPGATRLGEELGLSRARVLLQMRRPLDEPLPEVRWPEGVRVRTYESGDGPAWLALNALAFAHHPEQGGWTAEDLRLRTREPWFDPAGFFLALRGEQLVGFHWTKAHDAALGEVYVVGVDPAEQGNGLGSALTAAGLHHLRDTGHAEVLLYVDEDNPAAVAVYGRLGFRVVASDVQWVADDVS